MPSGTGFISGSATLEGIGLIRDAAGRFISAQSLVADVNAELAEELQLATVDALDSSIIRPAVSTGRLKTVLEDPRNKHSDQFGFWVGDIAFMSSSQAKYWRTQDEGSLAVWKHPFTGTILRGIWGGTINAGVGGKPFTRSGEATGGKFVPIGKRPVVRPGTSGYKKALGRVGSGGLGAEVRHEIEAHDFFQKGLEAIGGIAGMRARYEQALGSAISFK